KRRVAEGRNGIFENEVLRGIAAKYRKSVAQIILRWLTQREVVAIPKSVRTERIIENFDIFDIDLAQEDMDAIAKLDTKTSSFFGLPVVLADPYSAASRIVRLTTGSCAARSRRSPQSRWRLLRRFAISKSITWPVTRASSTTPFTI